MGISIVKLRGIAEKYGMTISELLYEIIDGYNKPEEKRTIHIKNLERVPMSQLQKLYKDYQDKENKEKVKKPWELDEFKKQEIQEQSSQIVEAKIEKDDFFEFVKKHTGNFSYLLESRETLEARGKRGKFPKVSDEEIEQYFKLQELIETINGQVGVEEENLIRDAIASEKCNPTEIKILNARLEVIKKEKESKELS